MANSFNQVKQVQPLIGVPTEINETLLSRTQQKFPMMHCAMCGTQKCVTMSSRQCYEGQGIDK